VTEEFHSQGRLTHGPKANAQVERTIAFVQSELHQWRDRPGRRVETAEENLNAQLCKHLNSRARQGFPMVLFHHEEKQAKGRRVDISAGLTEDGFVGTAYHTIDDPFLVIEGKRLPPPGGKAREREYLTGGQAKTGGIQRFKLGLHGGQLETVVMIGYIQQDSSAQWHDRLNRWIRELTKKQSGCDEQWELTDLLRKFEVDNGSRIASCRSMHSRKGETISDHLYIHHFWIEMQPDSENRAKSSSG